jgi:hypothetical protein
MRACSRRVAENVLKQVEVVELSRGQNDKTDLTEHVRSARRNEIKLKLKRSSPGKD